MWTNDQIIALEAVVNGGDVSQADREAIKAILLGVGKLTTRVKELEERVIWLDGQLTGAYDDQADTAAVLAEHILAGLKVQPGGAGITPAELAETLAKTDELIRAAEQGQDIAAYAGVVLRFVAKLVV